jgi:Tn3 transposase DDE domain
MKFATKRGVCLWELLMHKALVHFGALGLIINALVLWNTRYMDAALNRLRSLGFEVKSEDVARLSPLSDKHFNVLGRYHFTVTESILKGELRPLRTCDAPEELFLAVGA